MKSASEFLLSVASYSSKARVYRTVYEYFSKFCITFVFHFSWVLQPFQEKLKTMIMQSLEFGGGGGRVGVEQIRCIMGDVQVANTVSQDRPIKV